MRQQTDDYPAIYLFYVFLMFAALGVGAAIAALVLLR